MLNPNLDKDAPSLREARRRALYEQQKETLRLFLERGAISRRQYEKSLRDLTEKMGFHGQEDV